MTETNHNQPKPASPFFCFAVGISPEEGRQRVLLSRLAELRDRNSWLVGLRWLAALGLVAATTVARYVFDMPVEARWLYVVAVVLVVYNAIFRTVARRRADGAPAEEQLARERLIATAQIAIDLAILMMMLHFSGGVENPFFFYFVFHMIIASILLERTASFHIATFGVVLFAALVICEYTGVIPHHVLWTSGAALYQNATFVLTALVVFTTTMFFSVYFAGDIVRKLRTREAELVGVTSSLERGSLDLAEAYEKIRVLEEKKSGFLRVAAHQLRSPLSAIRSLLDVVLDGYASDPKAGLDMLERARGRTDMMLALVNDLLDLSRLKDAEDVAAEKARLVSVCELLAELNSLYQPKADAKGITLVVNGPQSSCSISAFEDDIRQALNNILDNAISYTPRGGRIEATAETNGGRLVIRISDTGIGIPSDSLEHLFDEFYRAPNAKAAQPHGTGLGLAIVKRAVEKWGGTVEVESAVGKGTTFELTFSEA
jgi:signal transduction histidine kinase